MTKAAENNVEVTFEQKVEKMQNVMRARKDFEIEKKDMSANNLKRLIECVEVLSRSDTCALFVKADLNAITIAKSKIYDLFRIEDIVTLYLRNTLVSKNASGQGRYIAAIVQVINAALAEKRNVVTMRDIEHAMSKTRDNVSEATISRQADINKNALKALCVFTKEDKILETIAFDENSVVLKELQRIAKQDAKA